MQHAVVKCFNRLPVSVQGQFRAYVKKVSLVRKRITYPGIRIIGGPKPPVVSVNTTVYGQSSLYISSMRSLYCLAMAARLTFMVGVTSPSSV